MASLTPKRENTEGIKGSLLQLATKQQQYSRQAFRANDIRGLAEEEITSEFAFSLGRAFAKRVIQGSESRVMICRDARLSSPGLHVRLIAGLPSLHSQSHGLDIDDVGIGPTPLLGFGLAQSDNIHSGIYARKAKTH